MRKNIFLPAAAIALLILSGCTYFDYHPDDPARNCRIEKISFDILNTTTEVFEAGEAYFSYDAHNNPTLMLFNIPHSLWPMDKVFRYDEHNRLIVYVQDFIYEETSPVFWHKYTYISPTKIIDSTFIYCSGDYTVNDHPDSYSYMKIRELTLDLFGRITKEVTTYDDASGSEERIFSYNADGNLIKPGVTYTNKPNIRQTHKVWRFIDMDYSINQPEGEVDVFNAYNLPYQFNDERFGSRSSELPIAYPNTVVEYRCD